jgi:hypothetical protein
MSSMSRLISIVILALAFGMHCCNNSNSPPKVMPPPLPLVSRIQPPDPSKYAAYDVIPWNEWNNPRVIVRSEGIEVLLSGASSTVPPQKVGNVLEKTTESDWPLGLVVMAEINGIVSDPQKVEANRVELVKTLTKLGIRSVWGPPPA